MTLPVTLPSTISSPTRVFYSPFPPPYDQQQQQQKAIHIPSKQQKHSIRPYEISTTLAKSYDIYNKQILSPPIRVSSLANSQENLIEPISSSNSSSYSSISSQTSDDEDEDDDIYEPFDDLNYYYYDQRNNKKKDYIKRIPSVPVISHHQQYQQKQKQSLSVLVTLKPSKSTSAIKGSSSSSSPHRLPRWIKHMSQNTGFINMDKKRSRGFPSLQLTPNHMTSMILSSTTTMTFYYDSPLARQYLKSVTKKNQWDDMLTNGFPCPFCSDQEQINDIRKSIHEKRHQQQHQHENSKKICKRCHGQKRLMTLRITFTPQHARAKEDILYNKPSLPSQQQQDLIDHQYPISSVSPENTSLDNNSSLHKSSLDNKKKHEYQQRQNANFPPPPLLVKPSRSTPTFKCKKLYNVK
ncbi:unnamed protein product [Cunninghamella echinulata]